MRKPIVVVSIIQIIDLLMDSFFEAWDFSIQMSGLNKEATEERKMKPERLAGEATGHDEISKYVVLCPCWPIGALACESICP